MSGMAIKTRVAGRGGRHLEVIHAAGDAQCKAVAISHSEVRLILVVAAVGFEQIWRVSG
jgi:hypothetical protein